MDLNLEEAFVAAIINEGRPALRKAFERGISPEWFSGTGKEVFQYVLDHATRYGELPSLEVVWGKTGIELPKNPGSAEFFIDTVVEQRLWRKLREGQRQIEGLLDSRKASEAFELWQKIEWEINQERLSRAPSSAFKDLLPQVLEFYEDMKAGKRGIPFPFPSMTEATLGIWPQDLILLAARLGVGKCVDAASRIQDPETGVLRTIEEVYSGEQVGTVSWSRNEGIHARRITAKVDTGRKRCLKVELRSGRFVIVTPEHPFLTPDGWRKAEEVAVGDSLASPARLPHPTRPTTLPDHEVAALALLLACGSCAEGRIGFSTTDIRVVRIAEGVAERLGIRVKDRGNGEWEFENNASSPIREMLNRLGVGQALDRVPEAVFRLPPTQLSRFISMFWACGRTIEGGMGVKADSEGLIRDIQHLLLRFGVQSRVVESSPKAGGEGSSAWRLLVYPHSREAFRGVSNSRANHTADRYPSTIAAGPVVSESFRNRVEESFTRDPDLLKRVAEKLQWNGPLSVEDLFGPGNRLFLPLFAACCEAAALKDEHGWLYASDIFWDDVIRIEDAGERKIYDLTVEPTECFIANDVIVHNTWSLLLIAKAAWIAGYRVLIATTEMSKERIAQRFAALHFQLPYSQFRRGSLNPYVEKAMYEAVHKMMSEDDGRLRIIGGDFDFRIENLASAIDESLPELVVVDGAYLIQTQGSSRTERAAEAFNGLKRIANNRKIGMVVSSQFNRDAKKGSKDSAAIENVALTDVAGWNADVCFALYQTEDMWRDKRMIYKPLKVREGKGEDVEVIWDIDAMHFEEVPTSADEGYGEEDPFGTGVNSSGALEATHGKFGGGTDPLF